MTKLMSMAALLFAIGCGGAAPSSPAAENEEALSNGQCYSQYQQCAAECGYDDSLCLCFCHNALSNCTVPKGRLYKCPPDTISSLKADEAPAPQN